MNQTSKSKECRLVFAVLTDRVVSVAAQSELFEESNRPLMSGLDLNETHEYKQGVQIGSVNGHRIPLAVS